MQLSETVKLYLTEEQKILVISAMNEYIRTVNSLVSDAANGISISRYTTADVAAELPSAITNQCIRDAKSIIGKYNKACRKAVRKIASSASTGEASVMNAPRLPVLKRPCCYVNNQNFRVKDNSIEFPVLVNGKSKRISVRVKMTERQRSLLSGVKLGTMRIVTKGRTVAAQLVYDIAEPEFYTDGRYMGVDLGIKCPAVSYVSGGSVRFYGNGRKNKYMRRHYAYLRRKLQKGKHMDAVKRINDKEQRIMKDTDHKISHDIIATAVAHDVKVIKLERLANIRSTTRTSRKNDHSLHTWSFYRLAKFIEYKANLAGIKVEYVNPAYTSRIAKQKYCNRKEQLRSYIKRFRFGSRTYICSHIGKLSTRRRYNYCS